MLLLVLLLGFQETIDMSTWQKPVGYAVSPLLWRDRLVLWDDVDERVRVYRFDGDLQNGALLWQSAGVGQGPGQIPNNPQIMNFVVNEQNGHVWLSHRYGYSEWDAVGNHVALHPFRGNSSMIAIAKGRLFFSPHHFVFTDWLLAACPTTNIRERLWTLPNPNAFPINEEGSHILPGIEIYGNQSRLFRFDANIGILSSVGFDGVLQWQQNLPMLMPDLMQVSDYSKPKRHQRLTLASIPESTSGFAEDGEHVYVLSKFYSARLTTQKGEVHSESEGQEPFRILIRVQQSNGALTGRFAHALAQKSVSLLGIRDDRFLFFDMGEGNRLFLMARDALVPLK